MNSAWIPILITIAAFGTFVGLIGLGIVRYSQERKRRRAAASRPRGYFAFAKIIDNVTPMQRSFKYEKPLHDALQARGLGAVEGGGTQLSRDNVTIEWVGIDLELLNLEESVSFTCHKLREFGAPPGSLLQYTHNGQKISAQIN